MDSSLDLKYEITSKQAIWRINAFKSDGSVIKDIKFFQEAYKLIALGWIYAPTRLPVIDKVIEFIYRFWVKNRLKLMFYLRCEKYALKGFLIFNDYL